MNVRWQRPAAWAAIPLTVVALALGACGGNDNNQASTQQRAQTAVCNARDDIATQVNRLSSLTVTTATVDQVRSGLTAIANDLQTIANQQSELSSQRRSEVEQASRTFADQVSTIVSDLGTNLSVSAAQRQLQSALDQLAVAYRNSLAQVNCS